MEKRNFPRRRRVQPSVTLPLFGLADLPGSDAAYNRTRTRYGREARVSRASPSLVRRIVEAQNPLDDVCVRLHIVRGALDAAWTC